MGLTSIAVTRREHPPIVSRRPTAMRIGDVVRAPGECWMTEVSLISPLQPETTSADHQIGRHNAQFAGCAGSAPMSALARRRVNSQRGDPALPPVAGRLQQHAGYLSVPRSMARVSRP
jgi:hypothetical protein